jgi:hypothetical protein
MNYGDFLNGLSQFDSRTQDSQTEQAIPGQVGGIYIGRAAPGPDVPLALNADYLEMVRDARALSDEKKPQKDKARAVYTTLCKHWLDNVNQVLSTDRYNSVALAESVFGFNLDEDPQMTRLDASYTWHSGVIGLVYEVCQRSSLCSVTDVDPNVSAERAPDIDLERPRKRQRRGRGNFAEPAPPQAPAPWLDKRLEVSRRLHKVIEVIYHLHELLHTVYRATLAADPQEPVSHPVNEYDLMRFSHLPMDDLNAYQALVIALSRYFIHMRYRRDGEMVCREQMIALAGQAGSLSHTHYWKPIISIRDAVTHFCNKNTHGNSWANSTRMASNFENAVTYFTAGRDVDLPPVSRFRRLFSFHNGLLVLGNTLPGYIGPPLREDGHGRFFFYPGLGPLEQSSSHIPLDVHSSRLFKSDFPTDYAWILNSNQPMKEHILQHTEINGKYFPTAWPTPLFDSLLERQGYTFFQRPYNSEHITIPVLSSMFQIFAMLGRLLYPVGELDNFQVAIFFLGIAGTGKSIICEIVSKFYGKEAIGKLSANCQTTFAISSMVDKNLIICPEVKSNFGLAASDFQSMVTGESVSANRKHQETLTVRKWTSQMLLAGNDVPPWPDSLGAIFRRLFCVRLEHAVRDDQVDTTIARKLRVELPALLLKFHACYLQLLEDFAEVSFWSFADEKFRKAREGIEQELNPTKKFLYNADMLDRDNEDQRTHEQFSYYIPYARFMELCTDWCKKQNITIRMSSSNREQHNKKIFDDSKYAMLTMNLPFGMGLPPRQAVFVLGVTDLSCPLQLPPDWRSLVVHIK